MASNLLSSTFLCRTPQCLKKFLDVGIRKESLSSKVTVKSKSDPLVNTPGKQTYRNKTAYQLLEFNEKYQLLKPGFKVLNIGAAPGSWSQVLAYKTNANKSEPNFPAGLVIAVDSESFDDIDGVITLPNTDILKETSQKKIMDYLGPKEKFDFIFSNMITENRLMTYDKRRVQKLMYCIMLFSVKSLKKGGGVLIKIQKTEGKSNFRNDMNKFFESVNFVKLGQTKGDSLPELYFLGTNFVGLNK